MKMADVHSIDSVQPRQNNHQWMIYNERLGVCRQTEFKADLSGCKLERQRLIMVKKEGIGALNMGRLHMSAIAWQEDECAAGFAAC